MTLMLLVGWSIRMLIKKQIRLYKERIKAIKNKNILEIIKLIFEINLYSRKRYWLTDIYYCLKN